MPTLDDEITLANLQIKLKNAEDKLAEALRWNDVEDKWNLVIHESFPTRSGSHTEYALAMEMVGNRRSKGQLVALVNWLLIAWKRAEKERDTAYHDTRTMRRALDKDPDLHLRELSDLNGVLEAELDLERTRNLRLRKALGYDQPWSVTSTFVRLANAAEHLLDVHGCDAHGYEEVSESVKRARDYATNIELLLNPDLRRKDARCSECDP